jgi:hypothetical protein
VRRLRGTGPFSSVVVSEIGFRRGPAANRYRVPEPVRRDRHTKDE